MKRLLILFLLVLISPGTARTAEKVTQGSLENPYEYGKALIRSFDWAKSGMERSLASSKLLQTRINDQDVAEFMFQTRLADIDYDRAAREVEPFMKSKNEAIQISAEGAYEAYTGLIDADRKGLELLQKMYGALISGKPNAIDSGEIMGRMTDFRVAKNQSWKLLALAAAPAAAHAFVKIPERKDEKLSRLSLTADERQDLLLSLEKLFGASVKGGVKAGQESLVAAAALIHQFLSDQNWKSLDSK